MKARPQRDKIQLRDGLAGPERGRAESKDMSPSATEKSEGTALPTLNEAERSRRAKRPTATEKSEGTALPVLNEAERSRRT
ncbi:hypothetical protein B4O97_17460 [Marispirochaeta aestuarii]|uniref:Uncharacterized protein n=1 Tax=Marispirochaeta aestuarii TaxID=1963862 RepID=A0A1Y1RTM5_9SPIO|nr:hypothetical protein B4O97_17460 [Marispirochaeta aestuarii]